MAKKRFYGENMKDPRRSMERADFEMISEDKKACANLPQEVIQKDWPHTTYFDHSDLSKWDDVRGIDRQMDEDANEASRHRSKSKY